MQRGVYLTPDKLMGDEIIKGSAILVFQDRLLFVRRGLIVFWATFFGGALIGLLAFFLQNGDEISVGLAVCIVIAALLAAIVATFSNLDFVYWSFRRIPCDFLKAHYEIDEGKLVIRNAAGAEASYPWTVFCKLQSNERLLMFKPRSSSNWICLARRAFEPDDEKRIISFARKSGVAG